MSYLELKGGFVFDLESPAFNVPVRAIAYQLAHINRFNGAVGAYSVAQHCVQVAALLPPELKLAGLLHDAHECVIGDMASPLKQYHPSFKVMEERMLDAIDRRFDVNTRHQLVHAADLRMLVSEARDFGLSFKLDGVQPVDTEIKRWSAKTAEEAWLMAFNAYKGKY